MIHPLKYLDQYFIFEVKKTAQPATAMAKNFPTLKEIPGMQLGSGCILCLAEKLVKTSEMLSIVPIEYI